MEKFVSGLITGSVLTLAGIGIVAAINDDTLSNPLDAWSVISETEWEKEDAPCEEE